MRNPSRAHIITYGPTLAPKAACNSSTVKASPFRSRMATHTSSGRAVERKFPIGTETTGEGCEERSVLLDGRVVLLGGLAGPAFLGILELGRSMACALMAGCEARIASSMLAASVLCC